jgi:hypothetical protein
MTDLETIGKQIDETRHLLADNTNKLIERDSHLDDIERQTANLHLNSNSFRMKTRNLKNRMQADYYFKMISFVLCFFFVIGVIIIIKYSEN